MTLIVIFAPLILSVLLFAIFKNRENSNFTKYFSLIWFLFLFVYSFNLYDSVDSSQGFLFLGEYLKVEIFGFNLTLQVDKLSAIMLILTSSLLILISLSSWSVKNSNSYFALLIFFSGAIYGVFLTTNLLWFFIFWEVTLVPLYFLVGIWGAERRIYASVKFFLYTHFASMLILFAFFLIFNQTGTFEITEIKEVAIATPILVWWLMFIGFAVKLPSFPFHTWLPDAHVEAPAPISVLLAGILLKMGAYALIRFLILMMPETSILNSDYILIFGLATLLFAGILAIYQTHIKKMVAYSSVSHMGLVIIAISTMTFNGLSSALFEMIAHAFVISPLFLIAGFLHHKTKSWEMPDYGGLMQKIPFISAIFVLAGLSALGLPATIGFIGELSVLITAIESHGFWLGIIAIGSIISATYIIRGFRKVIYGEISELVQKTEFKMHLIEVLALIFFAIFIIVFGIYPQPIFDATNSAFEFYQQIGGLK